MTGLLYNISEAKKKVDRDDMVKWLYIFSAVKLVVFILAVLSSEYARALYILYLMWLMVIAYVDYYTGYVYVKMEYAVIGPAILCLICLMCTQQGSEYTTALMVSVCIMAVLLKLCSKAGWFGEGDSDVLIFTSVFLSSKVALYNSNADTVHIIMDSIVVNMLYISVSGLLFIIRYIGCIKPGSLSLRMRKPFVPSIYMVGILFFVFYVK